MKEVIEIMMEIYLDRRQTRTSEVKRKHNEHIPGMINIPGWLEQRKRKRESDRERVRKKKKTKPERK